MTKRILRMLKVRARFYRNPQDVGGWLCWLETRSGKCIGFVHQDGRCNFSF